MSIEDQLVDELGSQFQRLRTAKAGSEEEKAAAETLTKLLDRKIESDRVNSELLMKQQQLDDEKKDRLIKNILSAAGIALPLLVTIWGTKVSLKFEEEGTFTTIAGRSFVSNLFRKK